MHMHPCPFDFQSLGFWAERERREDELQQMEYVDRDACRKSGYYGPFVLPSSKLFLDFCASLVDRYGLAPLVTACTLSSLLPLPLIGWVREVEPPRAHEQPRARAARVASLPDRAHACMYASSVWRSLAARMCSSKGIASSGSTRLDAHAPK